MKRSKAAIGRAFGGAAGYETYAIVQRQAAARLARQIASLPLPAHPRILEIGCGTGFLTRELLTLGLSGEWIVTDLSPEMVSRCRKALGRHSHQHFLAMDGEHPCFAEGNGFDLICSSLAFQWFEDLSGSIGRLFGLLAKGGHLVFSTMADSSFAEWRAAHDEHGLPAGTPDYPHVDTLAAFSPPGAVAAVEDEVVIQRYGTAASFLRMLREIGAHVSKAGRRPLSPGMMRKVMGSFEESGAAATHHIAFCTFSRPL